ncbi:hypothetical protein RJ639_016101 [Escallonia herrerae]|uniref:Uncharacterized protein n=1 Tax=Escallonia herrerae TaxID=1293975 RepID=A0AA88VD48_9ASTE|nr:hypothetical protein RJ639_016101 [Escallonia herrerae]
MSETPVLKRPRIESNGEVAMAEENGAQQDREEQEEALVALIEHRAKEVEHLRKRMAYYKSELEKLIWNFELDQAERRLEDSQSKLARLRGRDNPELVQDNIKSSKNPPGDGVKDVKLEQRSTNTVQTSEVSSQNEQQFRPQLVLPAVKPKLMESGTKASSGSGSRPSTSVPTHMKSIAKPKGEKSHRSSSEQDDVERQNKGTKRKFEQQEHKELISLICSRASPCTIHCQTGCLISSQHKRKLRSLVLCPTNDQLFITRSSANFLSSTDCASLKQRRWPEDIAWHPEGSSLLSVYTSDGGDSQIAVLNLNKGKERTRVSFLEEKPHLKGIINNIVFMPWEDTCFVTGGSDHAVVLWNEKDGGNSWKPKVVHRSMHSSAVMGVAGMQQKQIVISAGADKRIIGFDLRAGRADYKHQIESKCMSVLPNPCDFNLFMVQTGTPERQLRLFDIRVRQTEVHAFGWKQESSESQSALINQAWSPNGLYITSGSADPVIHIFDIRFNAHRPSQSIKAHQKRVFKAVWHHTLPLLISISSDLNIGLHKIT